MRRTLIAFLIASAPGSPAFATSQQELNSLAGHLGVRLQILDNKPSNCPGQANGCFLSELDLTIPERLGSDLASGDFKIYFSSVSPVIEADSDAFGVRLINGDLHVLEPRPGVTLKAGADVSDQALVSGPLLLGILSDAEHVHRVAASSLPK